MNRWLYFPPWPAGHVGGFPSPTRRRGQVHKVTSCAVPELGRGGTILAVPGGQQGRHKEPHVLSNPMASLSASHNSTHAKGCDSLGGY